MENYISRFKKNVNHVFKGKPASFRAQHQKEFDDIRASLASQLMDNHEHRSQTDTRLIYVVHMAKFRRVARRIGLMKPRIRRKR